MSDINTQGILLPDAEEIKRRLETVPGVLDAIKKALYPRIAKLAESRLSVEQLADRFFTEARDYAMQADLAAEFVNFFIQEWLEALVQDEEFAKKMIDYLYA